MPFDEDFEDISKLKMVGKNNNSMFNKPSNNNFDEKVKKVEDDKKQYKKQIASISLQLKNILNDKTLVSNKSELDKIMENDVLKEVIDLASKINSDPSEQEGYGSILLCTLLMKMLLSFRDKNNQLSYDLACLQKKVDDFPKLVESRIERLNGRKMDI